MYIKEVELNDFKSFHEQSFKFDKGLTVITGSNGSGKSNVFDSMVFALGNNSPKTLRYKSINELIHKGMNAEFARVKLTFDDNTTIERYVTDGASVFRLNGKRTTLEAISAFLQEYKVRCDGHNIVLQDDVKKIVEMGDLERRKYIDEIANISKFDEQKQKALKNLEKVNEKINEVKLVLNERKEWLDKLEKEKSSAERYLYLDRQKLLTEATILKKEKRQLQKDAASLTTRLSNLENELVESSKKIADQIKLIGKLEEDLKKKMEEYEKQTKDFSNIDSKFSVENYKEQNLRNELEEKQNAYQEAKQLLQNFSKLKSELEKEEQVLISKQKSLEKQLNEIESETKKYGNLDALKQKVSSQEKQNKEIKQRLQDIESKLTNSKDSLRRIEVAEAIRKDTELRLKDVDKEIIAINEMISKDSKDLTVQFNSILHELEQKEKEKSELQTQHEHIFDKRRELENGVVKYEQEIKTLGSLDFKLQEPIFVSDDKEIDSFVSKKEEKNEFGTFVFLFKGNEDYSKKVIIKNVLPEGKIAKLKTEVNAKQREFEKAEKEYVQLKNKLMELEYSISKLSETKINLESNIRNKDANLTQLKKRLEFLEKEKRSYVIEEKIEDKTKIIKEIEKLEFEKDALSGKISVADVQNLSKYLELLDHKSKLESEINIVKIESARIEEKQTALHNDHKKSNEKINELEKITIKLTKEFETQQKVVKDLIKEKQEFESRVLGKKKECEIVENNLSDAKNEKNRLNDFIVKGEADKDHIRESIFIKEKQLNDKIDEVKSFVEFNKNKDIDFESLDDYENKGISELREYILEVKTELEGLGSVNLKAIADYQEIFDKYNEIKQKMDILDVEREEVSKDIDKISLEKEKIFMGYYTKLRANFKRITKEFGLGDIDLSLTDKNLDIAGMQILIKRGSHERVLSSLSGGEKSLTTIAFVLSIVEFEPAPFYLFDEIDAALDYKNTEKVMAYLKKLANNGQIIMISHNPESVDMADSLIGISKNRLGITTVAVKQNRTANTLEGSA